jgi:hypothetical protein
MVYISILEQQSKFGDALEILSGKLGSLLMIKVDKLRMQVISIAFFLSIQLNWGDIGIWELGGCFSMVNMVES